MISRDRDDDALTRFVWWCGDDEIPPLARFLLHSMCVKDRFLRWDNGSGSREFRRDTDHALDMLHRSSSQTARSTALDRLRGLTNDVGSAVRGLADLQRAAEMGLADMTAAVTWRDGVEAPGTFPAEEIGFVRRFHRAVGDDRYYLETVGDLAATYRESCVAPVPAASTTRHVRVAFIADVVGYGSRSVAEADLVRSRCYALFNAVLDRMHADRGDRMVETRGDETVGLLPLATDPSQALPELITTTELLLNEDNKQHTDQLAVRMAIGLGLVSSDQYGLHGRLVTRLARLVGCRQIRRIAGQAGRPLVVIVADRLYQEVVPDGYPMPDDVRFTEVSVQEKEYSAPGWLWTPSLRQ